MNTTALTTTLPPRSTRLSASHRPRTRPDLDRTLRALRREQIPVSSQDRSTGDIWLGLLHGPDVWCRVGIHLSHHHFVVQLRAFSEEEALGYLRWRYEAVIDDQVEVGSQQVDEYGFAYCDMTREFTGMLEMVSWVGKMLHAGLESGLEFSARRGFDFSPDGSDMAWHFATAM